jgi:hypothetical protein
MIAALDLINTTHGDGSIFGDLWDNVTQKFIGYATLNALVKRGYLTTVEFDELNARQKRHYTYYEDRFYRLVKNDG